MWLCEQGLRVGLLKPKTTQEQLMVMTAQGGHVQVCRKQIPADFGVTMLDPCRDLILSMRSENKPSLQMNSLM